MRTRFDRQLEQLNVELIRMGALCEEAISIVAKSLLDSDLTYLPHALDLDDQIDDKEREIEALCMKILLQQQPVAGGILGTEDDLGYGADRRPGPGYRRDAGICRAVQV